MHLRNRCIRSSVGQESMEWNPYAQEESPWPKEDQVEMPYTRWDDAICTKIRNSPWGANKQLQKCQLLMLSWANSCRGKCHSWPADQHADLPVVQRLTRWHAQITAAVAIVVTDCGREVTGTIKLRTLNYCIVLLNLDDPIISTLGVYSGQLSIQNSSKTLLGPHSFPFFFRSAHFYPKSLVKWKVTASPDLINSLPERVAVLICWTPENWFEEVPVWWLFQNT